MIEPGNSFYFLLIHHALKKPTTKIRITSKTAAAKTLRIAFSGRRIARELPALPPRIPPAAIRRGRAAEEKGSPRKRRARSLLPWANNMINNDPKTCSRSLKENKSFSATTLTGPPPMPRKEESAPRKSPAAAIFFFPGQVQRSASLIGKVKNQDHCHQ